MTEHRADHSITVNEAGRRAGQATLAKYGVEHFRKAGRKGGPASYAKRGEQAYQEMRERAKLAPKPPVDREKSRQGGIKGGRKLAAERGPEYYRAISKLAHATKAAKRAT